MGRQLKCSNTFEPWADLAAVLKVTACVFMHLHMLLSLCLSLSSSPPWPASHSSVHPSFLPSFSKYLLSKYFMF